MKILLYPDPILKKAAQKVTSFDSELHDTLDKMKTIMVGAKGLGLAANQVGISKTFFIMKDRKGAVWEFINPEIVESEGTQTFQEGCLSFPQIFIPIQRAASVTVKFMDRNGNDLQVIADGIEAVTIQHEIDHLNGIVFLER